MTLYNNERSNRVRIIRITGAKTVRRLLSDLGIHAGDTVSIKQSAPFGGPVLIERDRMQVALGKKIAECIIVEEVR